jgi:type IV secretion system protein VirB3
VSGLDRDIIFVALTRPQTFAGVAYGIVVANVVITTELFIIFKSPWVLAVAVLFHLAAFVASLREPRVFHIWFVRASHCPRVRNWPIWRCNSYRP